MKHDVGGFFGNPALRLLLRLKFRGGIRKQVRRLKQPKHWVFLILGGLAAGSWVFAVLFNSISGRHEPQLGPHTLLIAQVSMLVLFSLTVIGAFSYRGLYLPKDEIEMGFSSPLTRSDLVRYRLFVSLMKSLIAGLLFGIVASMRVGGSVYAFLGVFTAMLTIPLVGQGTALVLGGAESRIGRLAKHVPSRVITRVLLVAFIVLVVWFVQSDGADAELFPAVDGHDTWSLDRIAAHPVVRAVLWPFTPWANMVTAQSFGQFAPYFVFAVALWLFLFETVARIRIDYRELSLATSADVARRISRMRKGKFDATRGNVTRATIGWRVPWLFGRGAFGAVAWQKSASIVRKSRGTLIVSALIVLFLTILSTFVVNGDDDKFLVAGSALIAGIGTIYMCAGLRFDFRADLDIMDRIKTWPLRPSLLFTATILPEVLLVSAILCLAVVGRSVWLGQFHPGLVGVLAFQPLLTLTWVSLDNAVFLFSPIRYTPGEEGALQNMGRSMLLMILRAGLGVAVLVAAGAPAALVYYVVESTTKSSVTAWWAAGSVAWIGLFIVDIALIWLGGRMLKRFDVARDRPV
ncbi:MAG: hypothetical protein JNL28_10580 [Planctomycetes bacterium]|nr:hypothetical protein [Planctomycetota bacterium]